MAKKIPVHPLHRPVHPYLRNAVIASGVILVILTIFAVFQSQKPVPTWQSSLPTPAPTSILANAGAISPPPLPSDTWREYHNWKYGYSIKLPDEFRPYVVPNTLDPNTDLSQLPVNDSTVFAEEAKRDERGYKPGKYGFTIKIGYLIHYMNNVTAACASDEDCYGLLSKEVPYNSIHFPLYALVAGRQIKGLGVFYQPPNQYILTYPLSVDSKYFAVEFRFNGLTEKQIKEKIPVINTILSTVTVGK